MAIIRKGAYEWTIEEWGAGQNSRTPPGQLPANQHAVINNLYVDEETLKLRHGSTAVPTDGPIGASTTAGAKGLYVWYPDDGTRRLVAAYPHAASSKVGLFLVHTASSTALGGDLATAQDIAMAGFERRLYVSDGRSRLKYTDGTNTAVSPTIDTPGLVETKYYLRFLGIPERGGRDGWGRDPRILAILGTPPHASRYPEDLGYTSVWGFPIYVRNRAGAQSLTAHGQGFSMSIETGLGQPVADLAGQWAMRLQGTASLVTGAGVYYSYGTGGTNPVGGLHFWAKSTRLGEFMYFELLDAGGSARMRELPLRFNQTGRWEYKVQTFDYLPRMDRENIGSARFRVADNSATFTVDLGAIYIDGLAKGAYEIAPAFYDSDLGVESPLGDPYPVVTRDDPVKRAFSLPGMRTVDASVDKVRWYRRGGFSAEWRFAVEVPVNTHAWDFAADIDLGGFSPRVPLPAPRAKLLTRYGDNRMAALGGWDIGDMMGAMPTGATLLGTTTVTNMSQVNVGGLSRGVEFYPYTTGAATPTGSFVLKLTEGGATKRKATINASKLAMSRWNTAVWTSGYPIESGSGTHLLTWSGMADCNFRVGSYTTGRKPSYYHLLDHSQRVWVSRWGRPTWFDRLTRADTQYEDGWWFDLPGAENESIQGYGHYGSDLLIFTEDASYILTGENAGDTSTLRLNSHIGCASHQSIAECDDWLIWVGGKQGALRVYAFGPEMQTAIWLPAHEGQGFSRIGMPIEPILNKVTTPSRINAVFARGRYYLFFGETVTHKNDTYTGVCFDLATRCWVGLFQSSVRVKTPRFAAVTRDATDEILLASPAGSTAGNNTNKLWKFDYSATWSDGTSPQAYTYESAQKGRPGARTTRARGYSILARSATAGTVYVNARADEASQGTPTESLAGTKALVSLEHRFGAKAQGRGVGVRITGTAATAIEFQSVQLFLDRKR